MNIAQIGNFDPPHSSENEFRRAFDQLGHDVWLVQEQNRQRWDELIARIHEFDLVIWTRTADLAKHIPDAVQRNMLIAARKAEVPTCAAHLDRWWGLTANGREDSVWSEPYFRCQHFFSTDGAHDLEWATAGVNHHWMAPGVSEFECEPGTARDEWAADIGFVGSTRHYHPEHTHRPQLIAWLRDTYGDRFRTFPEPGQPAFRRDDLRDLVASVKVWVGDSCLAPRRDGGPMRRYWSDRVPELTGRGGYLLHPYVEGLAVAHPSVPMWPMGEWDALRALIDGALADDTERRRVFAAQRAETLAKHTYTVRMAEVLEAVGL